MENPYGGLFGAPAAPLVPDNPYAALWGTGGQGGLSLLDQQAREQKRRQLAEIAAHGDVGTVRTPDTSAGAVLAESAKMAGASLMDNAVSIPQQTEAVLAIPGNALRKAALQRDPARRAAPLFEDSTPPRWAAAAFSEPGLALLDQRIYEDRRRQLREVDARGDVGPLDPPPSTNMPLATEQGVYGDLAAATGGIYDRQRQRLADAAQDLPTPVSTAIYLGSDLAGQMAEPTNLGGAAALRAPRAEKPISEAVAAMLAGGDTAITRPEVDAALARGVEPVHAGYGGQGQAQAFGAWLDRQGLDATDATPPLRQKFFDLHEPDVPRETPPSPAELARINGQPDPRIEAYNAAREASPAPAAPTGYRFQLDPSSPSGHPDRGGVFFSPDPNPGTYRGAGGNSMFEGGSSLVNAPMDFQNPAILEEPHPGPRNGLSTAVLEQHDPDFLHMAVVAKPPAQQLILEQMGVPSFEAKRIVGRGGGVSLAKDRRAADILRDLGHDGAVLSREGKPVEFLDLRPQSAPPEDLLKNVPIGPRPSEAGFVRNPWAPESDTYRQTYGIRHDFVTEQNAAVHQSAERSKALQSAVPSRTARQDMTAVFHGTGNPLVRGDSADAAAARLAASPYAQPAADAVAAWRQRSDELFKMAKDSGADQLGYFKDYMHMMYEPPKGEIPIRGSASAEGTTTSVMRERSFDNPAQAMAMGYKPKSLDFSVLMHETERAHAHTRAILGLMDDIGAVNENLAAHGVPEPAIVRAGVNPDPKLYVRVEGFPILDRAAPGKVDPEAVQMARKMGAEAGQANAAVQAQRFQPTLPGMEGMAQQPMTAPGIPETPPNIYVHRDLWRNLAPVLKSDAQVPLDRALSAVKRINFLGSMFHGLSLTEASIKSMGPLRGGYEAARRGFGIPGVSQLAARLGGGRVAEDSVLEAIKAGVNVEAPKLDVMKGTFEGMLRDGEEAIAKPGASPLHPRNAMGKVLAGLRGTAAYYDEALWTNYHAPLKVTAYHVLLDRLEKSPSKAVAAMPREDLQRSVAQFVNDGFGGQNWQLLHNATLSDPTAQRWMRRVFLSPDWNVSAIRTGLSPFSADPVRRQLGRTYWKNAAGLLIGYNMLNYGLSGHFMWDNESGHKFDLETGGHDQTGRKIFYQVGKHARETPEFFFGRDRATYHEPPVLGFALRKLNPLLSGAITAATGTSPSGFPGALDRAKDLADRQARPLTATEGTIARARDLTGGLIPFVAQDPSSTLRKMAIPFVETKGMSARDGRVLFAEAMRKGDNGQVQQIRQWLVDNGYNGEQISRAFSDAQRGMREEAKANDGPIAPPPTTPAAPPNPYDGVWK